LSFCVVRVGDTVDDGLCLIRGYLLVVGLDVAEMVAAVVVRLPHTHTVVGKVDITVVAEELRHRGTIACPKLKVKLAVGVGMRWLGVPARSDSASQELKAQESRMSAFLAPTVLALYVIVTCIRCNHAAPEILGT
jgi:hypothetical protein